jgi:hypothetical protein
VVRIQKGGVTKQPFLHFADDPEIIHEAQVLYFNIQTCGGQAMNKFIQATKKPLSTRGNSV